MYAQTESDYVETIDYTESKTTLYSLPLMFNFIHKTCMACITTTFG